MPFSVKKYESLRPKRELKALTFLIALLVASAFFVPFIISGKGYFIFYGDFNVQQIPFYKMCHAAVKSGNIKWSFTTDLGANFIGSYSFYLLGSPFFWLTIPFPNSFVPYLMGPLLILKFACAAFTSYLYIRRFVRTPRAAMLGGLLYAFSGFSVYNIFFNHFHEAIIVFPLLLLALEYLITENRRGVFALAVCLAAVTNYFFFFGMAVFCVIYYFVRVGMKAVKFRITRLLWIIFEAVLGVCMAAALLLPAIMAILGNSRLSEFSLGWNAIMYGKEQIYLNVIQCFFFPPDLPARPVFFPGADVKWSSLGGWLPLFGMTGVIAWFCARKKTWIKRLLVICILMSLVPILNSAFYAFNAAYYARWFYMPILIMCLATVRVCEEDDIDLIAGFKWSASITVIFALVIGFFPKKTDDGNIILGIFEQPDSIDHFARFWITSGIAILSLAGLLAIYLFTKKNRRRFIRITTAAVCAVSVLYSCVFVYLGRTHSYDIENVMINSLIEGKLDLPGDKDTFRIDTYDCVDNTGMYLGYSSMNAFHSIVPSSIMEFYDYLGITRDVASRVNNEYPALRSLFSVKYLLDRKGDDSFVDDNGNNLMPGYEYLKTANNHYIYENKNFVGYGFSYDYAMDSNFISNYDGKAISRLMLKAVLLTDAQKQKYSDCFADLKVATDKTAQTQPAAIQTETASGQMTASEQASGQMTASEQASGQMTASEQASGQTTASEQASGQTTASEQASGQTTASEQASGQNTASEQASGQMTASEQASGQTTASEQASGQTTASEQAQTPSFPAISLDLTDTEMAIDCARLNVTAAKSFKTDKDGFTAKVNRNKKTLVFFSVPYDEGWSATVNGKPVEIEKVNVGFMAVPVGAGESTIRFTYTTPGLSAGMITTGISFLIFVLYFIFAGRILKNKPFEDEYPEGDELIDMWQRYEIEKIVNIKNEEPEYKSILDGLADISEQNKNESGGEISGGFSVNTDIFND